MKLGFVSAILPELSLEQLFTFAVAEGFTCVELMCWPVGKADRKFAGSPGRHQSQPQRSR
jgi:sugar phosphate isomerase/epimerase